MADDRARMDDRLSLLDALLRDGRRERALEELLELDAELTRYIRGEERVLFPVIDRFMPVSPGATESMRAEHRSLRRLLDTLGEMIARGDEKRGLETLATLRSVLVLHVAKEDLVLYPLLRIAPA